MGERTTNAPPAMRQMMLAYVMAEQGQPPQLVLDSVTSHLALAIVSVAMIDKKSRGETKAMTRKIFEDLMATVEANYDTQVREKARGPSSV